ncbi:MAG: Uma2 family endonuclease [Anaerolineae bacterium]|nr:Uma2 family endonuclease [Anaerolineae bacterium]
MALAKQQEQKPLHMTETDYLDFEEQSEIKHEYVNGNVYSMAGASLTHTVICQNTGTTLDNQLADTPCLVVSTDLRLKVDSKVSFRYPDVMVICEDPQYVDGRVDTIANPTVTLEVLSPSTALVDRNEKLDEYTRLNSVQEYVIISQSEAKIERYTRQESGEWLYKKVIGLGNSIDLPLQFA